jgi:hypothetical protein
MLLAYTLLWMDKNYVLLKTDSMLQGDCCQEKRVKLATKLKGNPRVGILWP